MDDTEDDRKVSKGNFQPDEKGTVQWAVRTLQLRHSRVYE